MGRTASPVQSWRGGTGHSSSRSRVARVLNTAIVLAGVTYLLYIVALAADPRPLLRASHSVHHLRVRVRSISGSAAAAEHAGQQAHNAAGSVPNFAEQVVPGGNQAPPLTGDSQQQLPLEQQVEQDPMAIVAAGDDSAATAIKAGEGHATGQGSTGSQEVEQEAVQDGAAVEDGVLGGLGGDVHAARQQQQWQDQQMQRQQQQQQQRQEQERQRDTHEHAATAGER